MRTAPCRIKTAPQKRKQIKFRVLTAGSSHAWLLCADCLSQGVEPRSGVTEQASQAVRAGEMMGLTGRVANDRFMWLSCYLWYRSRLPGLDVRPGCMLQAIRAWGVRQRAPSRAAEGSTPSSIFIEVCTISCLKILHMTRGTARPLTCDAVLDQGKKSVMAMPKQVWTTAGGKAQNL